MSYQEKAEKLHKEHEELKKKYEIALDVLNKVIAFHGCHTIYTKDVVTGELYELSDTPLKVALNKINEE